MAYGKWALLASTVAIVLVGCSAPHSRSETRANRDGGKRPGNIGSDTGRAEMSRHVSGIDDRIRFTKDNLGVIGWTRCRNGPDVQQATLAMVRAASAESLQHPKLAPSIYFEKSADELMVVISWLEDKPSLRRVRIVNPDSGASFVVAIPRTHLAKIAERDSDGILYTFLANIPKQTLGKTPNHVLQLRAEQPDSGSTAQSYPCERD